MRSMTGYGQGACEVGGRRLVVEVRSVNHRFLEVKTRLPWAEPELELRCGQAVRARIGRGALLVSVREEGGSGAADVRLDLALAERYRDALERLRARLDLREEVSLALVAAQPGVLAVGAAVESPAQLFAALAPAIAAALDALIAARGREGAAMKQDLAGRLVALERLGERIAGLAKEAPDLLRRRLGERLERALAGAELEALRADPARLAQEVALLADKADIAEEVARLGEHLRECRRLLEVDEPCGRRLDFLTQELNRELNTIGAKAQSGAVTRAVIDAKTELERLREQVQNIE